MVAFIVKVGGCFVFAFLVFMLCSVLGIDHKIVYAGANITITVGFLAWVLGFLFSITTVTVKS